jgi:hypothetical protein
MFLENVLKKIHRSRKTTFHTSSLGNYCGLCRWPKCELVLNWFFLPKPGSLEFAAAEIT